MLRASYGSLRQRAKELFDRSPSISWPCFGTGVILNAEGAPPSPILGRTGAPLALDVIRKSGSHVSCDCHEAPQYSTSFAARMPSAPTFPDAPILLYRPRIARPMLGWTCACGREPCSANAIGKLKSKHTKAPPPGGFFSFRQSFSGLSGARRCPPSGSTLEPRITLRRHEDRCRISAGQRPRCRRWGDPCPLQPRAAKSEVASAGCQLDESHVAFTEEGFEYGSGGERIVGFEEADHGYWKESARILDRECTHPVRGAHHEYWTPRTWCAAPLSHDCGHCWTVAVVERSASGRGLWLPPWLRVYPEIDISPIETRLQAHEGA